MPGRCAHLVEVGPGAACADSYDCDPGNFCEPTLHQCLPQPDPLTCKIQPTFNDLTVTLEHSYTAQHIISIPVVANLDGVGAPEIVINTTLNTTGDFYDGQIVESGGPELANVLETDGYERAETMRCSSSLIGSRRRFG